jgi:hypothetical protein
MSNQIQRGRILYKKPQDNISSTRQNHYLGRIHPKQNNNLILKIKRIKRRGNIYRLTQQNIGWVDINNVDEVSSESIPTETIPNENYTDLLPVDMLQLLSKYPTAKNSGIIYITNVVLNTLSNDTSTTVTRDLPFYNAFSFGTYLVIGKTYSLTVTICDINITYPAAVISVWIDWNQTNSYDEEDWTQVTSNTPIGGSATIEIVVPPTAKIGTTGMRIRSRGASGGNKNGPRDAYVDMGSGDTQDYPITILSEEL